MLEWNSAPLSQCRTEGSPATGHGCSMPRSCSHEVLSYTACRRQRPTEAAGRIEGQVKACDHSCADIDGERQKRATDRQSRFFIDDDQVDDRMIDLPNVVRPFRVEAAGARGHFGHQRNLAPPSCGSQSIEFVNAALDGCCDAAAGAPRFDKLR